MPMQFVFAEPRLGGAIRWIYFAKATPQRKLIRCSGVAASSSFGARLCGPQHIRIPWAPKAFERGYSVLKFLRVTDAMGSGVRTVSVRSGRAGRDAHELSSAFLTGETLRARDRPRSAENPNQAAAYPKPNSTK